MQTIPNKLKKLAISCGGTGGHFYPGLSIAREFSKTGGQVTLLLSGKHSIHQAQIAQNHNIESVQIPSSPRSLKPIPFLKFTRDLIYGSTKGVIALKLIKPDAFLAMGSFASIPSAIASKLCGIPLFLHEGNARIGKANIFLSRWAKLLAIAFPPVNDELCKTSIKNIGMPVRQELLEAKYNKQQAIKVLNNKYNTSFNRTIPTLLVFGGSQGTQIFNEIIPKELSKFAKEQLQVIHLTGQNKKDFVIDSYNNCSVNRLILESSPDMDLFYQSSDLVVCRSGGSTLAELAIFSKPAILVPYPYSADGHQLDNANHQKKHGAAQIIIDSEFTNECCKKILTEWIKKYSQNSVQASNAGGLAKPEASESMLNLIRANI